MRNIFSTINKYVVRQTENFLTEGFTFVLEVLFSNESEAGKKLLKQLSGLELEIEPSLLNISTQETIETGRPDIVISQMQDFHFFIEIKHDSSIGQLQLERYFQELELRKAKQKRLILLTRSKHSLKQTQLDKQNFRHVTWYEISSWMSEMNITDKVSEYVVGEFLGFLEEKNMTTEKVEWEYIQGIPSLMHLASMLRAALEDTLQGEDIRPSSGEKAFGFYFGKDKDGWLGVEYADHLNVYVAKAGPKQNYDEDYQGLNLEKSHFFALTGGEQLELLKKFIADSVQSIDIDLT